MSHPHDAGFPVGAFPDGPGAPEPGFTDAQLLALAGQVQTYSSDNQSFSRRSIGELLKLDAHLKGRKKTAGWGALLVAKAVPPDSLGRA